MAHQHGPHVLGVGRTHRFHAKGEALHMRMQCHHWVGTTSACPEFERRVIIPSFTFIATAHSLRWQIIDPVFCDVGMEDHLIDPTKIERLITPRTSAIMAVPIWGQPCDYTALQTIADKHSLKLIFDSAHAFGCKLGDQYLGGFGDAEVFSFHATKVFSTGEGGAITTNSDELAEKLRLMRNFGFKQKTL